MILTSSQLSFRPHGVNLQNTPVELSIDDIVDAVPGLTAGFIPNGLRVSTKVGQEHSFVVFRRCKWATLIKTTYPRRKGSFSGRRGGGVVLARQANAPWRARLWRRGFWAAAGVVGRRGLVLRGPRCEAGPPGEGRDPPTVGYRGA